MASAVRLALPDGRPLSCLAALAIRPVASNRISLIASVQCIDRGEPGGSRIAAGATGSRASSLRALGRSVSGGQPTPHAVTLPAIAGSQSGSGGRLKEDSIDRVN